VNFKQNLLNSIGFWTWRSIMNSKFYIWLHDIPVIGVIVRSTNKAKWFPFILKTVKGRWTTHKSHTFKISPKSIHSKKFVLRKKMFEKRRVIFQLCMTNTLKNEIHKHTHTRTIPLLLLLSFSLSHTHTIPFSHKHKHTLSLSSSFFSLSLTHTLKKDRNHPLNEPLP